MHVQPARARKPTASDRRTSESVSKKVLKWIGIFTAVLSLIAGVQQIGKFLLDRVHRNQKVKALLAAEKEEASGGDYRTAWSTLDEASAIDSDSADVRAAQEALAMEWLENIRLTEGERFTDITQKLEPVLTRGITSSSSASHRADLLAHQGWSYFLQSRDGRGGLDPTDAYARAVKADEHNPYAQSMWGHWILWNGGSMEDAMKHFDSALASGRQREFVRRMELTTLLDHHENSFDEEAIRVANQIRKEGGTIGDRDRKSLLENYDFRMVPPRPDTKAFVEAIPITEHLETFHWLFDKMGPDIARTYYLGVLEEAAGHRQEALKDYQSVLSQKGDQRGTLFEAAGLGVNRLSSKQNR